MAALVEHAASAPRASIRLRPLTAADAPVAAALIRAAFAAQPMRTDPPPSALRETADSVRAQIAAAGGMGAEADGALLVGVVLWAPKEDGLYLARLAVAADRRRQGIARALVAAAEAEARRRGLGRVYLGTRLALPGNRALFAACGFRETTRHAHPGHAAPTWVAMEKRLDAQG